MPVPPVRPVRPLSPRLQATARPALLLLPAGLLLVALPAGAAPEGAPPRVTAEAGRCAVTVDLGQDPGEVPVRVRARAASPTTPQDAAVALQDGRDWRESDGAARTFTVDLAGTRTPDGSAPGLAVQVTGRAGDRDAVHETTLRVPGCASEATPTATPEATATPSPTPTAEPAPGPTAGPTVTPTPTPTPTPTSAPSGSATPGPTGSPAPSGTASPSATPAPSGSATPRPSASPSTPPPSSASATPRPTASPSPSPTPAPAPAASGGGAAPFVLSPAAPSSAVGTGVSGTAPLSGSSVPPPMQVQGLSAGNGVAALPPLALGGAGAPAAAAPQVALPSPAPVFPLPSSTQPDVLARVEVARTPEVRDAVADLLPGALALGLAAASFLGLRRRA